MDERLLNKIISVAYNDAGIVDKIYIHYLALKNPDIKKLLDDYKETFRKIHDLKIDECSDEVSARVMNSLKINENKKSVFKDDFFTMFILNPRTILYAASVATLIVVFSIVFNIKRNENDYSPYTKQEVMQANTQIKESLALIGRVFTKTQSTITKEVIGNRIGKPINKSIKTINNLFLEGGKNESIN